MWAWLFGPSVEQKVIESLQEQVERLQREKEALQAELKALKKPAPTASAR